MDWKAPKSVRQIGNTKGKTKIYVEDYVMSFARKLSKERAENEIGGVLLGHRFYHAREKVFLISGMVSIKEFQSRGSDTFSQEMWTSIYTDIKENFTDLDVVGWYYAGHQKEGDKLDSLLELHRRNFSDGDKLLYTYDGKNRRDDFYLYENSNFSKQEGYYIYYEKNPEMRRYMMEEENRFVHIVEQEDDRVLRNIRGVLKENEERKKEKEEGKWTYGMAGLVVVMGLVLAVMAIGNQNGLADLRNQLTGIQTALKGTEKEKTSVETLGGGVISGAGINGQANTTASNVSNAAIISPTPTPIPNVPAAVVSESGIQGTS